jgi:hypothetical protein
MRANCLSDGRLSQIASERGNLAKIIKIKDLCALWMQKTALSRKHQAGAEVSGILGISVALPVKTKGNY